MWAKLFAAMVVAVAVTGAGVYFALPENTPELGPGETVSSAVEHSCCGVRKVSGCSLAVGDEACAAVHEDTAATTDAATTAQSTCPACPTEAVAAFSGVMAVAATGGQITNFDCCAD